MDCLVPFSFQLPPTKNWRPMLIRTEDAEKFQRTLLNRTTFRWFLNEICLNKICRWLWQSSTRFWNAFECSTRIDYARNQANEDDFLFFFWNLQLICESERRIAKDDSYCTRIRVHSAEYSGECTQCGWYTQWHAKQRTHSVNRKAHCVWHWCSALASVARTRSAYMCVCTSVEILRVITVLHSVGVLQWILHIQTHLRSGSNGNLLDRLSMLCIRMHSRLAFDSCFIKTPQPPLV